MNNPDFILARDATLNIFKRKNDPPSEDQIFNRPPRNNNIDMGYSPNQERPEMDEEYKEDLLSENGPPTTGKNIAAMIKESEMHSLGNKFSVGYEAFSNMKSKVQNVPLPQVPEHMRMNDNPGSREIVETQVLKNCLTSYFNIVRKHINDLVPKTIMAFLVNKTKDTAQ